MLYIQRSDGAYVAFSGLTQQVIIDMLSAQGLSCSFIDKAAFDAATQAKI